MNADVVTMLLVKGPMGTATVTERYSTAELLDSARLLASVTSHEEGGSGITMFSIKRGWSPWKEGWSWSRARADLMSTEAGRGVSVVELWSCGLS